MNQPKISKLRSLLREINFRSWMITCDYMIKFSRYWVKMNREASENKALRFENEMLKAKLKKHGIK